MDEKKKAFYVRDIPRDMHKQTHVVAAEKEITLNALWIEAMEKYLKREKKD